MDDGDATENLVQGGNHTAFNSPISKGDSPIIYPGSGKDDNVADRNSPMRGDNSPIDRKEQGTA